MTNEELSLIREYLERIIDEKDRQYQQRFRAADAAVASALLAQKEATAAAFAASESAIRKAEEAQREYNVRSNEFRGQLGDQAKQLAPRAEMLGLIKSTEEKIDVLRTTGDNRIDVLRGSIERNADALTRSMEEVRLAMAKMLTMEAYETRHGELQRQVNELREAVSKEAGSRAGTHQARDNFYQSGFLIATIVAVLVSSAVSIIIHFI
jgi:hypothetical protein